MPLLETNDVRVYYRLEGRDEAPAIVLIHALGLDHGQWDAQVPALLPFFKVLRLDLRGHGASSAPAGDYSMQQLAADAAALAGRLRIDRFAVCGLSIGGMVALRLAADCPDRVTGLVLANTTPRTNDTDVLEKRRRLVLDQGTRAVADSAIKRFFSPPFLDANPPVVATTRRTLVATDAVGYAGCCAAVRDMDHRPLLDGVTAPTLVIGGLLDQSMPWDTNGALLHAGIRGAEALHLAAAHLSNVEQPEAFSKALVNFLPRA